MPAVLPPCLPAPCPLVLWPPIPPWPMQVEGPNEEHGEYSAVISLAVCTNVTTQKHKQEFYWQASRKGAQMGSPQP